MTPEHLRRAVAAIKALSGLRIPPYDLPADSFLERTASAIIACGWEPMETAPKDGTRILVSFSGETHVVWWDGDDWITSYDCDSMPVTPFGDPEYWCAITLPAEPAPAK